MDNYDELDEFMAYMEESGVLEWVGMNPDGERTFQFRFDLMSQIMPDLYHAVMDEINTELIELYQNGLVDIEYDENLEPRFKINDAGKEYLLTNGIVLPEEFDEKS